MADSGGFCRPPLWAESPLIVNGQAANVRAEFYPIGRPNLEAFVPRGSRAADNSCPRARFYASLTDRNMQLGRPVCRAR